MANLGISRLTARPALAALLRYGLAVSSVAAALGTTLIQRHYNLVPRFISHFTLVAIAITFWYAGTGPGLLALSLSCLGSSLLARNHFLAPGFPLESFLILYAIFSLLVGWFSAVRRRAERSLTEARDNLELRVEERTGELTKANERLQSTQAELRRREAHLAEAQRLSQTGSFGWNIGSGEIYWSEETYNIFEHDRAAQPTLESAMSRIHPDDRELVQQALERATNEVTDFDLEHRLLMPDGSVKHIRVLARALATSSGNLEFVGAVTDVTAAKKAEETLRESEAYLAEAQRLGHTGSWAWTPATGDMRYWSKECYRLLGLDPYGERPRFETSFQRIHPDDQPRIAEQFEKAKREGTEFELDYRIVHPGGEIRDVHVVGHPVLSPSGDLVEFVGTVIDVTERKRAEETLRRSEGYLAEAQRMTGSGSWAWNVRTGELFWSQEVFRIYDYDPERMKPTWSHVLERVHPEDRSGVERRAKIESTQKERVDSEGDFRIVLPDGRIKNLHTIAHPVMDDSGEIAEVIGTVMDVTERKQAEEALRRSEGYLAEAQRMTRSGSWASNVHTRDTFWSQEMFRILGYDPEKTKPTFSGFLERVHPEDRSGVEQRAKIESTQKERVDSEGDFRIVLPDGRIRHLHSIAHSVMNESGQITEIVGTTMDVTEQHEARTALETAFEQIQALKDQLYKENIALREEVDKASMFEEIVGISPALHAVLSRVSKVAPTDSTVLITGETGTGKELIARAVHKRSQRSARAFVSVNCAAIPRDLIASELFGHEKGAFTGATQRRLGRFELAEGGTIFLDEIGELPAETQIALLRVLQEHEFGRVGGTGSIRTNVRVIAATNRDLEAAIAAGTFRSDLFYRLNVFPIEVPPLRERQEDIPVLVEYFIDRYARKAGKSIRGVNKKSLELLQSYPWPGNIRELQNVIERSVIVCDTENFSVDESWLSRQPVAGEPKGQVELSRKLAAQEKEIIEAALRESRGQVAGPTGAAAKLGIPGSTLESKIRSLKINKNRFRTSDTSTDRV